MSGSSPIVAWCLLMLTSLTPAIPGPPTAGVLSVVPKPLKMDRASGVFRLNEKTQIVLEKKPEEFKGIAEFLAGRLRQSTGFTLPVINPGPHFDAIVFAVTGGAAAADTEAYSMSVTPQGIVISSSHPAGAFYAVQTLLQLLPPEIEYRSLIHDKEWTIPCVKIEDRPRFSWRGMHLDVGRHYAPVQFIKKYLDLLASYKFNVFHWHLTEDQGWRLEIKKYPRLTEAGAWRSETMGNGIPYGGFYTQDEVREIVAYARERFITVVPEIEMPGHSVAALTAYPELSCTGGPFAVRTTWGISDDVYCAGNDRTFDFLEDVLGEVFALFPGQVVHIGGDECPKIRWLACPRCRSRMEDEGLTSGEELQSYFIRRIGRFLKDHGKRLIGWDEILEGGLAPNAMVMSWRGTEGGIRAAKAGHDVVMTPTSSCYFDYRQGLSGEPSPVGDFLPLEKVYAYDPIPEGLAKEEAGHILGAQGNVWTEQLTGPDRVEYMAFPRACALSEVVWSQASARNLGDFSERMAGQYARLLGAGVNFRIPTPAGIEGNRFFFRDTVVAVNNPVPGAEVRYTLDGSEPTKASAVVHGSVRITSDAELKVRTFLPEGASGPVATGYFSKVDSSLHGLEFLTYSAAMLDSTGKNVAAPQGHVYTVSLDGLTVGNDTHALVFAGFLRVDREGLYTFYLDTPMHATLRIGLTSVAYDSGSSSATPVRIYLEAGSHEFWLALKRRDANIGLEFEMEGPGLDRRPIPPSMLRRYAE